MATRGQVLPVGPPVALEWQIGRSRDIEEVRLAVAGGENIVLMDPRRTGKTTVALGALAQLAGAGFLVFVFDATDQPATTDELANRLRRQVAAYTAAGDKLFDTATKSVKPLYEIAKGALPALQDPGLETLLRSVLSTFEPVERTGVQEVAVALDEIAELSRCRGQMAVLLFDEVQAIAAWEDSAELQALLRRRLATPEQQPNIIFAGSEPTAMATLFAPTGVFRYQGPTHHLRVIRPEDWIDGLKRAFRALGCTIDDAAVEKILEASGGAVQRTMLIAREIHRVAQSSQTPDQVDDGYVTAGILSAQGQPQWEASPAQ